MTRAEELWQRLERYGPTPEVLRAILAYLLRRAAAQEERTHDQS